MMMYQSKLVASLKANGKILREFKDTVYIPFGSEYSFLIKNLNTTRALVNIFIDGEDVMEGGLVLNAGQEVDLERYVKNGNLSAGNRFKFIERTTAIEDGPRGTKLEDGLIRIEFQYEKPYVAPVLNRGLFYGNRYSNHDGIVGGMTQTSFNVNGALRSADFSQNGSVMAQAASAAVDKYCADNGIQNKSEVHDGMATMDWMAAPQNDVGITVPGSKSTQKFQTTVMGAMETEKHTIVLKLLGETPNNKPVLKPVTVFTHQKCTTCGRKNKATAKFCAECGTALEIFA
jgi:hypothetical protein